MRTIVIRVRAVLALTMLITLLGTVAADTGCECPCRCYKPPPPPPPPLRDMSAADAVGMALFAVPLMLLFGGLGWLLQHA
jgi:hypothetical protein